MSAIPLSFVGIFVGSYPIQCNNELIEWFRVKNMLREVIEKALQLSIAPNLDMGHRMEKVTH
jgi:hypothetical protein